VLEECAKFNEGCWHRLNWEGDKNPSSWKDGVVTTTPVSKRPSNSLPKAAGKACSTRWTLVARACPKPLVRLCGEMHQQLANMSFALCPLLTDGAIEALLTAGSDELKATYLEKLVSGEWTGTMNLTEPQAGSDLAAVRTRAEPQPDGTYKILAPRSSSPGVSTTWPRTSSIWCWPVCRARPKA
jgi:hypothetical protein